MKAWKVFLGVGVAVLIIGIIIFILGFALNGWTMNIDYEMQTFEQKDNCNTLDLNLSAGEMKIELYNGDKIEIDYPSSSRYGYEITESNGTLKVEPRKNFSVWFFWRKPPAVTVRVPNVVDGAVNLNLGVSAGYVTMDYGYFKNVKVDLSAGSVKIGRLICENFDVDMSAGLTSVNSLECKYSVNADVSAGSLMLGNIACNKIRTHISAGSANLNIAGTKRAYDITVDKSAGSCNVATQRGTDADKLLSLSISAGTVNVSFTN